MIPQMDPHHKYLVANGTDKLWGLYVTTIGFQSVAAHMPYPPARHPSAYRFDPDLGRVLNEYQILYVVSGKGQFRSAGCGLREINAGEVILAFPGEWHTYAPSAQTGWEAYWVGFKGSAIDSLIEHHFFSVQSPVLDIGFNEQMVSIFSQGIEIARSQMLGYQSMLAGMTQMLCGLIYYAGSNNSFGNHSFRDKEIIDKINHAKVLMQHCSRNCSSPEKIAAELNLSYSWFRKVFKEYTGSSPTRYYNELRLKKAKELLSTTTIPVKEISFNLNFESSSYFITFFKSKVGVSPTGYRDNIQARPVCRDLDIK